MKRRQTAAHSVLFTLLMVVAGCQRPATTAVIHLAGFPEARPVVRPLGGPWSGTTRSFQTGDGELFYLTITIDDDYCRYCTAHLESNGTTNFRVADVEDISYRNGDRKDGYITSPDRVYIRFEIED